MSRLFFVCRDCLKEPGIHFQHCAIVVARWNAGGWYPDPGARDVHDFMLVHVHRKPAGDLQFALIDEDSIQPEARSKFVGVHV